MYGCTDLHGLFMGLEGLTNDSTGNLPMLVMLKLVGALCVHDSAVHAWEYYLCKNAAKIILSEPPHTYMLALQRHLYSNWK